MRFTLSAMAMAMRTSYSSSMVRRNASPDLEIRVSSTHESPIRIHRFEYSSRLCSMRSGGGFKVDEGEGGVGAAGVILLASKIVKIESLKEHTRSLSCAPSIDQS
ncbi:hypothetical protein Syun_020814 [Stephania yunnanensis]|uniref:Uncharacterized protein n=1 Tax=Stephania yunnanensis TaxID=152371 RepID=A0AAP0IGF7_9MAGN